MLKALTDTLNARGHWLFAGVRGTVGSLSLVILLLMVSGCSWREAHVMQQINSEDTVRSLSLSGLHQASVIDERTRQLRLTDDAGKTWRVIPSASVGDAFECAFMLDQSLGWAVNHSGQVFKTTSAGKDWAKISVLKDFTGAHEIKFLDEREGWLQEFLSIWRTQDGGATWRKSLSSATPGFNGSISTMFVVTHDKIVATGSGGQVYITNDGGESWRITNAIAGTVSLQDVWFASDTHGWLTGYAVVVAGEKLRPLILETKDGGDKWTELPVEAHLLPSSICVIGDDWWLGGNRRTLNGQSISFSGVLLHSSDQGKHWDEIKFTVDNPVVKEVRFTDNEHGWLVSGNRVFRTEDAGRSWHPVLSLS